MEFEVMIAQRLEYGIKVSAASFNDAALLAEKVAKNDYIKKLKRAVGNVCLNDHETKVTGIYVNDGE